MNNAPIPFPVLHRPQAAPPFRKEYVGAVQQEHATQVQALFPEALEALRLRLETVQCVQSMKLILEVCLPAKGRLVSIGGTSPAHIEAALGSGKITPGEARDMAQAIAACRSIDQLEALMLEVAELRSAIDAMHR